MWRLKLPKRAPKAPPASSISNPPPWTGSLRDWLGRRSLRHNARTPHERGHFEFQFSEKPCAVLPKHRAVVIDHAAVTPRYVFGFSATRELPIVARIAAGSLRNKLFVLLPATLAVSYFLPRMLTPLLMLGGIYLCYEGTEKVLEAIAPHKVRDHEARVGTVAMNAQTLEDEKVGSAVKTDFILSAEIMAITLAAVPNASFWMQALVLAIVGIGITIAVYGVVALIVKADDIGVALAKHGGSSTASVMNRAFGRGLVLGMPGFLAF